MQPLVRVRESLCLPVDDAPSAARETRARAVELLRQLSQVRDDELACRRGGRRPHVGREVAERRVLFVPDRGDDRHGAACHCPHEPLVAERQQVLERAAAAGEHDHVHVAEIAERPYRLDHLGRGARALDVRLRDDDARGREPRRDRREDVAFRRRVVARDEPDPAREPRQRPLALDGEQALGGQAPLQPFQRGEVLAEAEPLDRQRPQAEVAARLEELGPSEDVHAGSVGEVQP